MRIFITGITGTIGRAFTEYLYAEHHVMGIDRNEEGVARFKRDFPQLDVNVGDFGDVEFVRKKMDLVIHLAAMKHVDLCETNVNECVMNNVVKTQRLFRSAFLSSVDILFMSTDKAVEPISMYGYTKSLGEGMAIEYGGSVIRSGNVLASTGSVLSIWEDQITNLKPIKVTHKDMTRYFVSPDNLVKRAWELYQQGQRIIIPKMDKKVRIVDLLSDVLESHGYTIDTYPYGIEYTGLRLGEKVHEKLEWGKNE